MKSAIFLLLLAVATVCCLNENPTIVPGSNRFAQNLYRILAQQEGNICFSPLSVHLALSMAYQGARDYTADTLARNLYLPQTKSAASSYNQLLSSLNTQPNITLSLANKIYLMEGQNLLRSFKSVITQQYQSDVQLLDFDDNEEAAHTINQWVQKQTRGKIDHLIDPSLFDSLTRLVLVNAIYFNGKWARKFSKPRPDVFYVNERQEVPAEMISVSDSFNFKYSAELEAEVIELPYVNKDFSLVVILPFRKNGIKVVEKKLVERDLRSVTEGFYRERVDVTLPKFKIGQNLKLKDSLTQLGLGNIFDRNQANFKDMIELRAGESLFVSDVIHKASLEVTEEGTEATAASGVIHALPVSLPPQFRADHPFIFFLRRVSTNDILFYGRLMKP